MRVLVKSNWGWWDQLDGETLRDGDLLEVTWPDGATTTETVVTRTTYEMVGDHGHDERTPRVEAFVAIRHRGAEGVVRLVAAGVSCRRVGR